MGSFRRSLSEPPLWVTAAQKVDWTEETRWDGAAGSYSPQSHSLMEALSVAALAD